MPDCQSPKTWKEDLRLREEFCLAHLCRNGDCASNVEDMHLYCDEHECSKPGCVARISGNSLCHEHAILQNTQTIREATKSESQGWIRTLQPRDYSPAAGQQYTLHMRDGGRRYEMLPPSPPARAFPSHHQRYESRPYGHPPSPETPFDSPASDIDEDEVLPGHNNGPSDPVRGNIGVGARANSGNGSGVLPAGVILQKRDAPVDKPSSLNVQNMQGGPGRVGGGTIQRP
ncbi:hypothetical protein CMQ_4086 [Grosmannia clavigera kw1407]|uniref:Uncharacterized protein n=1 Tax=Grosmannia clavigera (strain kw1407 / UAMH 11150) TaxID=655863 RepID=F0XA70_GROCL|nr:uncharacterized protein CMQ_4086 [Grosmannia clavigera kw1407]EFX06017.1 hypothetical protein CMQ_4086 [Grosmannia clavigera kw1407]